MENKEVKEVREVKEIRENYLSRLKYVYGQLCASRTVSKRESDPDALSHFEKLINECLPRDSNEKELRKFAKDLYMHNPTSYLMCIMGNPHYILLVEPRAITNHFTIHDLVFIKWDMEEQKYKVAKNLKGLERVFGRGRGIYQNREGYSRGRGNSQGHQGSQNREEYPARNFGGGAKRGRGRGRGTYGKEKYSNKKLEENIPVFPGEMMADDDVRDLDDNSDDTINYEVNDMEKRETEKTNSPKKAKEPSWRESDDDLEQF
jgi:hypothetical protein